MISTTCRGNAIVASTIVRLRSHTEQVANESEIFPKSWLIEGGTSGETPYGRRFPEY